ncbi:DUF4367 domain-containing protein [Desulfitobacterium sp. AusDCA]|uniref:DUF4367 domain-containing protein n=1 Tax=Desulfitobacterium sp. AusDCA TaxID=3240383 RepID=UPI003DA7693D
MALSEHELEELMIEATSKELKSIKVPNIDEQWTKFQKNLQLENNMTLKIVHHNINYKKMTWAAVILIIISSIVAFKPISTVAFGEQFIKLYNFIVGKTTKNQTESYQRTPSSDMPMVQDLGTNEEKELTFEEAKSTTPYKLAIPNYLPEGTKEQKVIATSIDSNIRKITIQYMIDGNMIEFEQSNTGRAASRGSLYDTDDTVLKELTINGATATLLTHKTGISTLNWEMRGLLLQLTGKISSEELVKMAESIT